MFTIHTYHYKDEERARRTIAKIESLLSRSNSERLQLFAAMKQIEMEESRV